VLHPEGTLEHGILLAPYVIWSDCTFCGGHELFYLRQFKNAVSNYCSFSTGHSICVHGEILQDSPSPKIALGMTAPSATRIAAVSGWRRLWSDLAKPWSRLLARAVDLAIAAGIACIGLFATLLLGLPVWSVLAATAVPLLAYEPVSAFRGGTVGKRLLEIEPVSVWHRRALSPGDQLRRALWFDLQFVFPPLAVRNLAWVIWDPARQPLHDRRAQSIVIAGRTSPTQRGLPARKIRLVRQGFLPAQAR